MVLINSFVCQLLISLLAIPLDLFGVITDGLYLSTFVCPFLAFIHTMFGKILKLFPCRVIHTIIYIFYKWCEIVVKLFWMSFRFMLFLWTRCISCTSILFFKWVQSVPLWTKSCNIYHIALHKDYMGVFISCVG